jgi:restriction endonuclease S subunit
MKPGDVLLGVIATIGTVSLVTNRFDKLTGSCKIAIVRPRLVESEYLAAYFISLAGQRELHRRARGTVQTGVILPDLKAMPIPLLDDKTRAKVRTVVQSAYAQSRRGEDTYSEAKEILESALGLDKLDLSTRMFFERSYANVNAAERLDAEFACVPELLSVWNPSCAVKPLGDLTVSRSVKNGITPAATEYGSTGVPIIKVGDITNFGAAEFGGDYVSSGTKSLNTAKGHIRPGDVLVLAAAHHIRYIGKAGFLEAWPDAQGKCQCVGELIAIRPSDSIRGEVLTCYLNTPAIRSQVQRLVRGMSAHLYPTDLKTLPIPLIDSELQLKIVVKVRESLEARREAGRLMARAKGLVEEAILGERGAG